MASGCGRPGPGSTKYSCEPLRTSAYGVDLRWRMVWQKEVKGLICKQVGENVSVDPSTVSRTVSLFKRSGSVNKKEYPAERAFRKLTEPLQLMVLHLVLERPGIYLREICDELARTTGADISESAVCQFLHKSGFTRQKMKLVAQQIDYGLRQQFVQDVSVYDPSMLVFLDETGADRRNTLRKHAYSLRGIPAQCQRLLVRGQHLSVVAIMSVCGILDCHIVEGSVDGDVLYDFVQKSVLPILMPFNGSNPHSVVILDNCSTHHVQEITKSIKEVGAIVHFLPPYSPDFNLIELAFSKLKACTREMDHEHQAGVDLETIVLAGFSCISVADCQNWIASSGLYND